MTDAKTTESIKWLNQYCRKHPLVKDGPSVHQQLEKAIDDYLQWMKSAGYSQITRQNYRPQLNQFLCFIKNRKFNWTEIFTFSTLQCFKKIRGQSSVTAINGLSRYLFSQGKIPKPLARRAQRIDLPKIYEDYLTYQQIHRQASGRQIRRIKRVLAFFDKYLQTHQIALHSLTIEQVDDFLTAFLAPFSPATANAYRSMIRQFLGYLYRERQIIKRDLSALIVGAHLFSQAKPPNFLRPHEVQKVFAGLRLTTPADIRTYAMVHLAYMLGLRPQEICSLTLDDLSFSRATLKVKDRKTKNSIKLPLPEELIKAIAAYLIGVRPQSQYRTLFLALQAPYGPLSATVVGYHISKCMRRVSRSSSAYWLRHTYAQNLLEAGVSIYEIKEMLGHDSIESTKKYLHIHIKLMRKVLFDETI
ncbi:MAG: tyrosine-type recombinase/integrase [Desulfobacterales bacterium]